MGIKLVRWNDSVNGTWREVCVGRIGVCMFVERLPAPVPPAQCRRLLDFTRTLGSGLEVTLLRRWHVAVSVSRHTVQGLVATLEGAG